MISSTYYIIYHSIPNNIIIHIPEFDGDSAKYNYFLEITEGNISSNTPNGSKRFKKSPAILAFVF